MTASRIRPALLLLWPSVLVLAVFNVGFHRAALTPEELDALYRRYDSHPVRAALAAPIEAVRFQYLRDGDELLFCVWASLMLGAPADLRVLADKSDHTWARLPSRPAAGRRLVPYRDFPVEFPPFALVPIALAGLWTTDPARYPYAFAALAAAAALALVVAGDAIARRLESRPRRLYALSAVALFLAGLTVETRLDVFAAACVAGAIWAAVTGRFALVGVWSGVAGAIKLYPLLLGPVLVLPLLFDERGALRSRWRELGHALAGLAVAMLGAGALVAATSWSGFWAGFAFQANRGLEVESVGATVLALWGLATGTPARSARAFGAMALVGADATAVAAVCRALVPLAAVAAAVVAWVRVRRGPVDRAALVVDAAGFALVGIWIASPVLSAQFLIWGLPALLLTSNRAARALYLAALAGTQVVYPTCWGLVSNLAPAGVAIVAVRNGLLCALWIVLARHLGARQTVPA